MRTGGVMLAHGRIDRARRCFQQVITNGAGREFSNFARFDLALTALAEGDRAAALDGLATCAEVDRSLAVVPPRFQIREVLGRSGTHMLLLCRDRESKTDYDIVVATLARPVGAQEHARFHDGAKKLAGIDHPAVRGIRGGFADGRLFGLMREPTPGFVLGDTLDDKPMPLDKALELLTALMEGIVGVPRRGRAAPQPQPRQRGGRARTARCCAASASRRWSASRARRCARPTAATWRRS